MARDKTLTYIDAGEFVRLAQRCFGSGWQEQFADYVGYNRTSISHFATAFQPVPPHIVLVLRMLADRLDNGQAPILLEPVAHIVDGAHTAYKRPA